MKQTLITLAIVGTILTIFAFTNSDNKSVGAIGDVKYSVLPPDKFKEENGNGWVLMDNNIPLQGSNLNTKHGITSLPDARGVFIRSLNLNRNDEKADPFSKENNRHRLVGEFQNDQIKLHKHEMSISAGAYRGWAGGWGGVGGTNPILAPGEDKLYAKELGGEETRPKNIALYTYIKINN
jgi:hypothetical protein